VGLIVRSLVSWSRVCSTIVLREPLVPCLRNSSQFQIWCESALVGVGIDVEVSCMAEVCVWGLVCMRETVRAQFSMVGGVM
jgi:hypothetical protein